MKGGCDQCGRAAPKWYVMCGYHIWYFCSEECARKKFPRGCQ
jgi:hypothetical protein